tara:strand:+ start:607 stop:873 length:267 start_codon:yes stop_codon:yes gene_type:complete
MKYMCFKCNLTQTKSQTCPNCGSKCQIQQRQKPYTTGQLAKLAGVHYRTVWLQVHLGKLESIQFEERGWHYIDRDVAHAWIESRKKAA